MSEKAARTVLMAAALPLSKIDHCRRRRLHFLLRRRNMHIFVRVALVFGIVAAYYLVRHWVHMASFLHFFIFWVVHSLLNKVRNHPQLDSRWQLSPKIRALFLGREPEPPVPQHGDQDYHDYYDYEF